MSWEWLSFGLFTGGYLMLSGYKTFQRFKLTLQPPKPVSNEIEKIPNQPVIKKNNFAFKKYMKQIINYCVSYNSSILVVGSITESYFFSLTMMTNILAISLGYIYAVIFIHPFTYRYFDLLFYFIICFFHYFFFLIFSLEKEIKTPFQFFEKRYRSKTIRAVSAFIAMFYQFSFASLFLWGSTNMLCLLIPALPFWLSIIILGVYSIIGSSMGGYAQATYINLAQFLIVVTIIGFVYFCLPFLDCI